MYIRCFIFIYFGFVVEFSQQYEIYYEGDMLVVRERLNSVSDGWDFYVYAVMICKVYHKQLVIIHERNKLQQVIDLMSKYNLTRIPLGLKVHDAYRSFKDFRWQNGEPLIFTEWNSVVGRRNCVGMSFNKTTSTHAWFTGYCDDLRISLTDFICDQGRDIPHEDIFKQLTKGKMKDSYSVFRCSNGVFVSFMYVCDGVMDCQDGSDETGCDYFWNSLGRTYYFKCGNEKSIPLEQRCNFWKDCLDGSDEKDCVYPDCPEGYFKCHNRQCIKEKYRCDHMITCVDGSDEADTICSSAVEETFMNGITKLRCPKTKTFYPAERDCDGYIDCTENIDESTYTCKKFYEMSYYSCGAALYDNNNTELSNKILDFGNDADLKLVQYSYHCKRLKSGLISTTLERYYPGLMIVQTTPGGNVAASRNQLLGLNCSQWIKIVCNDTNPPKEIKWINGITNIQFPDTTVHSQEVIFDSECDCMDPNKPKSCDSRFKWDVSNEDLLNGNYDDRLYVKISNASNLPFNHLIQNKMAGIYGVLSGPLICVENSSMLPDKYKEAKLQCKSGRWYYQHERCLLRINKNGDAETCRDLTHLDNCESIKCPEDYVKCVNSYCVHVSLLKDGVKHCKDGEDESNLYNYTCKGYFRCRKSTKCITHDMVCDDQIQCPEGDDETICTPCPNGCWCLGLKAKCTDFSLSQNALQLPNNTKYLDLSDNKLDNSAISKLFIFKTIIILKLYNCSLETLDNVTENGLFASHRNLVELDLRFNKLTYLSSNTFVGLINLRKLDISYNPHLKSLQPNCFFGMNMLEEIELSHAALQTIQPDVINLKQLKHLNISRNYIKMVDREAFSKLVSLTLLDMRKNPLKVHYKIFDHMTSLMTLYTDSFTFCCIAPPSVFDCIAPADDLSSCEDLLRNDILRIFLWLVGISAFIGNSFTLVYRTAIKRDAFKKPYSILVTNLGISDLIMGIYLLIIAVMDVYYRGTYVWNEYIWRTSTMCMVAGVLATVSSEASVIFIILITVERFILIKYSLKRGLVSRKTSTVLSFMNWLIAISFGIIPVILFPEFYSENGVCVALPLQSTFRPGRHFSVAIFIIFNSSAFVFIAVIQLLMYREIKKTRLRVRSSQTRKDHDIAKILSFVVLSDFLCWIPIGVMGIMALLGQDIRGDVYAWVIVFVLPINSALNPFLYTFSGICKKKKGKRPSGKSEDVSVTDIDATYAIVRVMSSKLVLPQHDQRGIQLDHVIGHLQLTDLYRIILSISKGLHLLHQFHIVHGMVSKEYIKIMKNGQGNITHAFLVMYDKRLLCDWDATQDMMQLGTLLRDLLRTVQQSKKNKNEMTIL